MGQSGIGHALGKGVVCEIYIAEQEPRVSTCICSRWGVLWGLSDRWCTAAATSSSAAGHKTPGDNRNWKSLGRNDAHGMSPLRTVPGKQYRYTPEGYRESTFGSLLTAIPST
jgi:hypothetical protein